MFFADRFVVAGTVWNAAVFGRPSISGYTFPVIVGDQTPELATGGTGDYALASGTNALANAGGLSADTGAGAGNNNDTAIDIGTNSTGANAPESAFAGNGDLTGNVDAIANPSGATGSNDTAIDIGDNGSLASSPLTGADGAFAGGGVLSDKPGAATTTPRSPSATSTAGVMAPRPSPATMTAPAVTAT